MPAETWKCHVYIVYIICFAPCQVSFLDFRILHVSSLRTEPSYRPWMYDICFFDKLVQQAVFHRVVSKLAPVGWYTKHDGTAAIFRVVLQEVDDLINRRQRITAVIVESYAPKHH